MVEPQTPAFDGGKEHQLEQSDPLYDVLAVGGLGGRHHFVSEHAAPVFDPMSFSRDGDAHWGFAHGSRHAQGMSEEPTCSRARLLNREGAGPYDVTRRCVEA